MILNMPPAVALLDVLIVPPKLVKVVPVLVKFPPNVVMRAETATAPTPFKSTFRGTPVAPEIAAPMVIVPPVA